MNKSRFAITNLIIAFCLTLGAAASFGQTTAFTYQGKLTDGGMAASATYDMIFRLFDDPTAGSQIGSSVNNPTVQTTNGIFTVQLDFGAAAFSGADRYLEINIRPAGSSGGYTQLLPRQKITSAPNAIRSLNAANADNAANAINAINATNATNAANATNASQLGGVAANQYVLTSDSRLSDSRNPLAGSTNYVQNTTTQQTSTNFNISGSGTAGTLSGNTVNSQNYYNLAGNKVLSVPGISTFGAVPSYSNTFVGVGAGIGDTPMNNGTVSGNLNTFFGFDAGYLNAMGGANSFVGYKAGYSNTTGTNSSFFGQSAGYNTTGGDNSFFGDTAGYSNGSGTNNTAVGSSADFVSQNLSHATVIGADATVSTSNTIALGRSDGSDTVLAYGKIQVNTLGAAGSTTLCRNASNQIASCSSSLRYKTNIQPFAFGLNFINQLRPISFDWKDGGMKDVGFGAEDVARVNPLFVNYNEKGEVEGVKYDRFSVLFVNAFKEQQTQIENQQKQIAEQAKQLAEQRAMIEDLQKIVSRKIGKTSNGQKRKK